MSSLGVTGTLTVNLAYKSGGSNSPVFVTYGENGIAESVGKSGWSIYDNWSVRYAPSSIYPPPDNNINTFTGSVWVYVGPNAVFTTSLTMPSLFLGRRMSSTTYGFGGVSLTEKAFVTIAPPACSITTQSSVMFDISQGLPVIQSSTPQTLNCGDNNAERDFQVSLQGQPVSPSTLNSQYTITLQNSDGQTNGGLLRGFMGDSVIDDASCSDATTSIPFDGSSAKFVTVSAGVQNIRQSPMVWVLCKSGTEKAGVAKGAAILDIVFN